MGEQKHTALLPCPFCGGSASMEQTESNRWSVGCDAADEPECMGYQSFTTFARRGEATKAWNTRAVNTYPAVSDLVEALEATQFGFNHRRCPVCAGWNVGPNGETDMAHTKDCIVGNALNRFRSLEAGKGGVG